jgi:hypothetical protein
MTIVVIGSESPKISATAPATSRSTMSTAPATSQIFGASPAFQRARIHR